MTTNQISSKIKLLIVIYGLLINLGLALHQYVMFVRAYLDPQKAIILYINYFGEANGELILLTLSICISIPATFYVLWCIRKNQNVV
jgi:hypothetical protein